jgi:hypothetical protein
MAPQSPRHSFSAAPARRRWRATSAKLRCVQLEDRVTPAVFNPQTPLTFGAGTMNNNGCVATADFNKDGLMDAVLTNYGTTTTDTTGNNVQVLYGQASGGFFRQQIATQGTNVSFASVADINNDTYPDLLVSNGNNQNTGTVSVFRNTGAAGGGLLQLVGSPFATGGNNASWVGAADVSGDGILDVVVANFGRVVPGTGGESSVTGNRVTVFQGNGTGGVGDFTYNPSPITNLQPPSSNPEVSGFVPTALAVADFDGDTIVDIAAVSQAIPPDFGEAYPPGLLFVFRGTGGGGFLAPEQIDSGGVLPVNIQAADLNGDTKMDLVVSNAGDPGDSTLALHFRWDNTSVAVFHNISSPGAVLFGIPSILTANTRGVFATAVADFNADGKQDIAAVNFGAPVFETVANPENASVAVFLQSATQSGVYLPPAPGKFDTMTGQAGGQYLAVGDFDNNGTPDVIVAHGYDTVTTLNQKVGVLLNANTAAPTVPAVTGTSVNNGAAQRSMVTSLTVTFNTQVTLGAGAFVVTPAAGGSAVPIAFTSSIVGGVTVATITFTGAIGGSIADGNWVLRTVASQVQNTSGGTMAADRTDAFHRLFGDLTGDRTVNGADFNPFRLAFGAGVGNPNYRADCDFNGDGVINGADFNEFRLRFGLSI